MGLKLRAVAGPEDVERVAAFNALIHDEATAPTWRVWMTEHPEASRSHWLFIEEEEAAGRVVAALCLLPWRLSYAGVELRSGEMGVVGTLEEYRGRGLQRALNVRFDELLRAGGYDLSHIQGIPYFYRQFGYEYAMPLEAWWRLELHMAPGAAPATGHSCRLATDDDLPELMRCYDEAARALDIAALRDEATWCYHLGPGLATETGAETWVVRDAQGAMGGYVRVARTGFGDGLIVAEASLLSPAAALAALATLRRLAVERAKPFIRINLPGDAPLVVAARGLGGYDGGAYAWQVRLPDPAALLRRLAPVLEQRVAASMYAGLSRDVTLNLYRERLTLCFEGGRLVTVTAGRGAGPADLRLPPPLLAPLLLGHRSLHEIAHIYPDAIAARESANLVDTLFPRMRSWLYQPY
jgi:Acetyltransferase (GNAT) domain